MSVGNEPEEVAVDQTGVLDCYSKGLELIL